MNINTVNISDVAPSRWRNGGGWTRELVAWPTPGDWAIRLSVADIGADGAFSRFPGVDRWFAVIEGAGVALSVGQREPITLSAGAPLYAFPGEEAVHCALAGGAVRDFNVMVRRDRATAVVRDVRDVPIVRGEARWVGAFVVERSVLAVGRGAPIELAPMTLVWMDNPAGDPYALDLSGGGAPGWWVELSLLR